MSDRDYYRLYKKYKKKYLQLRAGAETETETETETVDPCVKCVTDYDECIRTATRSSTTGILRPGDKTRCDQQQDRCEQDNNCPGYD